ncbi:MAG: cytidine deaminase [Bacteroidota bacterium]
MEYHDLVKRAKRSMQYAHAPYSNFRVGAALLCESGTIYTGSNIEISSYSLTICAERVALFKAVSEGEKKFSAIAVVSDDTEFTPPCGACRQALWELAGDIDVIMSNSRGDLEVTKLHTLLPEPFTAKHLQRSRKRYK